MNAMSHYPIPDEALDSDIAILGKKGGGKTFTAKGIVERLLDMGRRVLVLDPLGVWAGLRTAADGEHAGYPVAIFGGLRGDIPLDPAAAEPLAAIIANENLPAVIDLSELSKGAQQAFLLKFLHELRRVNHDALTIVLEESDVFAPQNPMGDDSKALFGEIDWIARRGRFRGFRLIAITQRPARLSKDVLTQCSTLIAHRLPAPQDRDAVKAWVDGNGDKDKAKEVFDTLARLDVGEAWVYAPEHDLLARARFPLIKTLDTSSTPKAGEQRIEPKTLAQVDVSAIRLALAAAVPEGKKAPKNITGNITADLAAAEHRGYERGLAEGREHGIKAGVAEGVRLARRAVEDIDLDRLGREYLDKAVPVKVIHFEPSIEHRPAPPETVRSSSNPSMSGIGAERRPLSVLASIYPGGYTETQWASLAGFKRTGGTWGTYKSRLRNAGRIEERGNLWYATAVGMQDVGDVPALPAPGPMLVNFWAGKIPGVGKMLTALMSVYPEAYSRDELAAVLEMAATGGTFGTYLSRLRANDLIVFNGGGGIRLSRSLMEPTP